MSLIEVDVIHVEGPQAVLQGRLNALSGEIATDLRGQEAALSIAVPQRFADPGLAVAVSLRRVDQCDAIVDGSADRGNGGPFVHFSHAASQRPRAQSQNGDLRAISAQISEIHVSPPSTLEARGAHHFRTPPTKCGSLVDFMLL